MRINISSHLREDKGKNKGKREVCLSDVCLSISYMPVTTFLLPYQVWQSHRKASVILCHLFMRLEQYHTTEIERGPQA